MGIMKIRRLNGRFELGQVVATPGAAEKLKEEDIYLGLRRHHLGDWGNVGLEDKEANEEAVEEGLRLLSSYTSEDGTKFWIITEADRSATTVLLPEEY
jgi:hypothetical protein